MEEITTRKRVEDAKKLRDENKTSVSAVASNDRVIKPCPFCGSIPVFPEAKDVYGTCYDAGCEDCGVATISLQIIDCFDRPRDHVHDAWNEKESKYANKYIEVARQEAVAMWNKRAL